MPAIPAEFIPEVQSYTVAMPTGVLATEVGGGAARYTLQYDRGVQRFGISMALTAGQFSVWNAFYFYSIAKGTVAFTMPLDSGLGTASHSVNILPDSYSARAQDGFWLVAFVVETTSAVYALSGPEVAAYGLSAASLPNGLEPMLESYGIGDPGGTMASDVAGGVGAYALDYARGLQRFACQLLLTAEQYAAWTVWFHRLVGKGSYTFDMPLDSGFGVQTHAANIVPGSVSATRSGGLLTLLSFAVDAEPKAYDMTPAQAQSLIDLYAIYTTDTDTLLAALARFALVDSLALDL
jgi:hypothetical protein